MKTRSLVIIGVAVAMGFSLSALANPLPETTSVAALNQIRSQISVKESAAMEAATMGSYRMAVERFQDVRGLLKKERRLAESLLREGASKRDDPKIRGMLRTNDADHNEVVEMLSLLRVAIGPVQ